MKAFEGDFLYKKVLGFDSPFMILKYWNFKIRL